MLGSILLGTRQIKSWSARVIGGIWYIGELTQGSHLMLRYQWCLPKRSIGALRPVSLLTAARLSGMVECIMLGIRVDGSTVKLSQGGHCLWMAGTQITGQFQQRHHSSLL